MKRVFLVLVCLGTLSRPASAQIDIDRLQIQNSHWLYDGRRIDEGHQPQPGKRVGFMPTAGDV